jgi:hypothetical protein
MSSQQQQQQQQEQQFVMVGGPGSSQPSVPATHGGARPAILSASSGETQLRDSTPAHRLIACKLMCGGLKPYSASTHSRLEPDCAASE